MDDYKKLSRVIRYLRGTRELHLILSAVSLNEIYWSIDGSYGSHTDMRGHTGACCTLGKGAVYTASTKQKLNAISSTETELIALHDILRQVIWTRYFMEAQGHEIRKNIVYQDNTSTMLLSKNGKRSSGKQTRHIGIRFFFVRDRVLRGELSLLYCPTAEMTSDFLSKPMQGSAFKKHRDAILNNDDGCPRPNPMIQPEQRSVLADEKIGRENEETNRDKIVGGDDHELGARENMLRVERRENITGISEDIPDKYFCPLAKNNVRKKIGEEKVHVAHKTDQKQNSRFADTKLRIDTKEEDKEESQLHDKEGADTMDCGERCHRSKKEKNDDKMVRGGDREIRNDVAKLLAADRTKDCTDSCVNVVQNGTPHHQDGEWIEVEKRGVRK